MLQVIRGDRENTEAQPPSSDSEMSHTKPQFERFVFLSKSTPYSQQAMEQSPVPAGPVDSIHCELGKYVAELEDPSLRHGSEVNQLLFWKERQAMFPTLKPVAEDLLAAPASQAYVERIFSVCGIMSTGNRNRMSKSLETRVCLKLNNNVLKQSGFQYY